MRVVRIVAVMVAAVATSVVSPPASAHTDLTSSTPAAGAVLASAPAEVVLRFAHALRGSTRVAVLGPGGADVAAGAPRVAGATVAVALRSPLPDGDYRIVYHAVTDDGHRQPGSVAFVIAAASAPVPPLTPGASTAVGPPVASTPPASRASVPAVGEGGVPTASASGDSGGGLDRWRDAGAGVLAVVVVATAGAAVVGLRRRRGGRSA